MSKLKEAHCLKVQVARTTESPTGLILAITPGCKIIQEYLIHGQTQIRTTTTGAEMEDGIMQIIILRPHTRACRSQVHRTCQHVKHSITAIRTLQIIMSDPLTATKLLGSFHKIGMETAWLKFQIPINPKLAGIVD